MDVQTNSEADERSPGCLLREAREAAGLSISDVADRLHLLQSVVSSLEKDCYERMRGEIFVKGYMRNYAKLLGLDDKQLLELYLGQRADRGPGEALSRNTARRSVQGQKSGGRIRRFGVLALLVAMAALMFMFNRDPAPQRSTGTGQAVVVETIGGERVIPLAGEPISPLTP